MSTNVIGHHLQENDTPAVFFDRDGTMIELVHHLNDASQVRLIHGCGNSIEELNKNGILTFVATNQSVIARKKLSVEGLKKIHNHLEHLLALENAYLNGIFYCPHHPEFKFLGDQSSFNGVCNCRKPATGMIEFASMQHNFSRSKSWFVGDTTSDIQTGKNAGLRTILLRSGYSGSDRLFNVKPDFILPTIASVSDLILRRFPILQSLMSEQLRVPIYQKRCILIYSLDLNLSREFANALRLLFVERSLCAHVVNVDMLTNESIETMCSNIFADDDLVLREYPTDFITEINNDFCYEHAIAPSDTLILEGTKLLEIQSLFPDEVSKKIYYGALPKYMNKFSISALKKIEEFLNSNCERFEPV